MTTAANTPIPSNKNPHIIDGGGLNGHQLQAPKTDNYIQRKNSQCEMNQSLLSREMQKYERMGMFTNKTPVNIKQNSVNHMKV